MSPSAVPTSRAFWELRAEQVMDRVFQPAAPGDPATADAGTEPEGPIDVLVHEHPSSETAPQQRGSAPTPRAGHWRRRALERMRQLGQEHRHRLDGLLGDTGKLVGLSGVLCLGLGALSLTFWHNWSSARHDLQQERNLLLLERLRSLTPGEAGASTDQASGTPQQPGEQARDGLPPPPPSEPWMEELSQLPQGSAPPAEVLRVPVSGAITQPAPPAVAGGGDGGGGAGLPQLVGVVQVPGRSGSAIFQMGGSSSTALVGESIGGSGWILRSATGDAAVIERNGEQRRVSISSGF